MITVDALVVADAAIAVRLGLDRPEAGTCYDGHVLRISGWVVSEDPARPVTGLWLQDGAVRHRLPVDRPRHDVAAAIPGAPVRCGFDVVVAAAGWRAAFTLDLVAARGEERVRLLAVTGRRSLLADDASVGPEPALVTSLGRSGSSWLVHLLGAHPLVSADPVWPHEASATTYWARTLCRVVESPHGLDEPGRPEFPETGSWWHSSHALGLPGIQGWLAEGAVDTMATAARAGIRGTHLALAAARGRDEPRWLVEKARPLRVRRLVRELFPRSREVVLVRDPRDMLASMNAFDARRGYAGFGRDRTVSEAAYVARLGSRARALADVVTERPEALVVRYERLVARPTEEVARLLEHLGLDPSDAPGVLERASADSACIAEHRTSEDADRSVGRWRRDLTGPQQELAQWEFGPVLAAFGYL